ncbi:MAG TPA: ABC transporter permease [Pseudonocardia sp.]|uniref:ABC transporter permease n=1 Tax=Pseudonocardia sp. TaxID=60912 RepID=UPI002CD925E1|nr:ABC transporter permease [Pseudonocardia sp.]HTF46013.1 ABC transporter permease [Pseudonocardia sp.]
MSVDRDVHPPEVAGTGARAMRSGWLERGGRLLGAKETGLAAVLVVIVLFLAWQSPNFLTSANLVVVSRQIALALFISIGMTFVILSGAIDLSVGSVVALVSVTVGQLMVTAGLQPVLATVLALVAGALVGVFNGAVVAYTRIPSFVVTLGMLAMASGLALGMTQGQTISGFPAGFLAIGQGSTLGVPNPVWLAALAAIVAHVVLARTTFGRHVYLLGSNEQAALLSGISVRRTKIVIFTIASTLAACAAIVETARLTVGQPSAGAGYELAAIGAVVIGGASLFGGEGSILGTVLGTTLLGLILNGLILLGISAYWQQVFSGAVIILAVGLNFWRQRQRQRS